MKPLENIYVKLFLYLGLDCVDRGSWRVERNGREILPMNSQTVTTSRGSLLAANADEFPTLFLYLLAEYSRTR